MYRNQRHSRLNQRDLFQNQTSQVVHAHAMGHGRIPHSGNIGRQCVPHVLLGIGRLAGDLLGRTRPELYQRAAGGRPYHRGDNGTGHLPDMGGIKRPGYCVVRMVGLYHRYRHSRCCRETRKFQDQTASHSSSVLERSILARHHLHHDIADPGDIETEKTQYINNIQRIIKRMNSNRKFCDSWEITLILVMSTHY